MHELPFTNRMLSIVLEEAKKAQARKVTKISLTVGELSGFVTDFIQLQFDMIKKDTIASGACLCFKQPPTRLRCLDCDIVYSTKGYELDCPNCGKRNIEVISGRDFCIDSIDIE